MLVDLKDYNRDLDFMYYLIVRGITNVEAARNQGVRAGLDKLADMVVAELQEEI